MDITISEINSMIKLWNVLLFILIVLILSGICVYREAKKTREVSFKEYKSRNQLRKYEFNKQKDKYK
jgi:steroid 5-alpha reductase family enzyme